MSAILADQAGARPVAVERSSGGPGHIDRGIAKFELAYEIISALDDDTAAFRAIDDGLRRIRAFANKLEEHARQRLRASVAAIEEAKRLAIAADQELTARRFVPRRTRR